LPDEEGDDVVGFHNRSAKKAAAAQAKKEE